MCRPVLGSCLDTRRFGVFERESSFDIAPLGKILKAAPIRRKKNVPVDAAACPRFLIQVVIGPVPRTPARHGVDVLSFFAQLLIVPEERRWKAVSGRSRQIRKTQSFCAAAALCASWMIKGYGKCEWDLPAPARGSSSRAVGDVAQPLHVVPPHKAA